MTYCYTIDSERCKGCGLCVSVCPKNVLEISDRINRKGYRPAFQARPKECITCAICCMICPDVAITIVEVKEKKQPTAAEEK